MPQLPRLPRSARANPLRQIFAAAEMVMRNGRAGHRNGVDIAAENAEIAMTRRDWSEASRRWQAILETYGENAPVRTYSRLARAHRLGGELAAAETAIEEGLARQRDDIGLVVEYAEIAMARRDWATAVARWQAILETSAGNAPVAAYSRLARAHRLSGELAAAETAIEEGLTRHRDDTGLAVEYAEIAMARRDWMEAVTRWRAILEASADTAAAGAYSRLARAYRFSGDLTAATSAVQEGLARHRDDIGLAVEYAEIAMARRDWAEAGKRWQAILEIHGEKAPSGVRQRMQRAEEAARASLARMRDRPRPVSQGPNGNWAFSVDLRQDWGGWVPHQSCRTEPEGWLEILQEFSTPGIRSAIDPIDAAIGKIIFSAEVIAPRSTRFMVGVWNNSLSEPLHLERPVTPKANGLIEVTLPAHSLRQRAWLVLAVTNPAEVRRVQFGRFALRAALATPSSRAQFQELGASTSEYRDSVRVTVGIASIPTRAAALETVVRLLLDQVDALYVYLNGYPTTPAFLDSPKIHTFTSARFDDRGDAGKFFGLKYVTDGVYIACDDDLLYPPNFVATLLEALERHGRRAIVGAHGVLLKQPIVDYYNSNYRWVFHYRNALQRDTFVHLLGTNAVAFDLAHVRPRLEEFEFLNMADVWLARYASVNHVPMVSFRRPDGWLKDIPETYDGSIYQTMTTSAGLKRLPALLCTNVLQDQNITILPNRPGFVFAVKTFNRVEYLKDCINSFVETANPDYNWKAIIADDGSSDGTEDYLQTLRIPFELHIIRNDRRYAVGQTNTIFQLARNLGYDFGFCVDDDVVFTQDGWDRLYYTAAMASGFHHLCHFNLKHYHQLADRAGLENGDAPFIDSTGLCAAHADAYSCMGALFTFTPDVLEAVGFADEPNFPIRGQWHIDFTARCCRAGYNTIAKCFDARHANEFLELQNTRIPSYRSAVPWESEEFRRTKNPAELARRDILLRDAHRVRVKFSPPPFIPSPTSTALERGETINTFFDTVFVLNLDRRPDRMARMDRLLTAFDIRFERFAASDGALPENRQEWLKYSERVAALAAAYPTAITSSKDFYSDYESQMDRTRFLIKKNHQPPIRTPGAWGYLLTMERLLERILHDGQKNVLVFDDDIGLLRDTDQVFRAAVRELPSDWRVFQLGAMQLDWQDAATYSEHLYCPNGFNFGSHAVGFQAKALPLLLLHTVNKLLPYDLGALNAVHRYYPSKCFCTTPNIAIQDNSESDIGSSDAVATQPSSALNRRLRWDIEKYVFGTDLRP
jgi:glycosyltransferase involved in cell wall biosynthesis/tetratricopeptide (TPR) repeat protein/GR25 family glycosyltransferase involved in LPS biosynthesis